MMPTQMQLVVASWSKISPFAQRTTALFYDKLFSLNPALEQQFLAVNLEHKSQIIALLGLALSSSNRIENIVTTMQEINRRCGDYDLAEHDYSSLGNAFIWMLAQCLDQEFSDEIRAAWMQRIALLSAAMKQELNEEVMYGFTD